jgi:hypothetical protein
VDIFATQFGKAELHDVITNNINNEEESFSFGGNDGHHAGNDHGVMQQRQ